MARFRPEPPFEHDRSPRVGVLLVNLGTPEAPTPAAVRRYLAEFLADPRVVEIPRAVWRIILHGFVLRTRPAQSARKYATIWSKDGSPLLVHSVKQRSLLQGLLGQRLKEAGLPPDLAVVELGMRYGSPTSPARSTGSGRPGASASSSSRCIRSTRPARPHRRSTPSTRMRGRCAGCRRSAASTASTTIPATSARSRRRSTTTGSSTGGPIPSCCRFHGVPRRTLDLGDPYHCQCQKTARLLARELGLDAKHWRVAFQSRFGRAAVAAAVDGRHARRARKGRQGARRRRLPGLRRRLPRDAGGDRHRGPADVPRRGRAGLPR